MGRDLRDGAERGLAPLPQQGALRVVGRHADRADAVRVRGGLHLPRLRLDTRRQPVDLDDQDRGGVGRIAGVREALGGNDDAVVHHLDGRGDDAASDDVRDRRRAFADVHEIEQHRSDRGRDRRQPHADPCDDPEGPLRAHDHAAQVVAGRLGSLAAQAFDRSVRHDDVQRQHVRGRDAVRQAVRPAGVRVRVPPDG